MGTAKRLRAEGATYPWMDMEAKTCSQRGLTHLRMKAQVLACTPASWRARGWKTK